MAPAYRAGPPGVPREEIGIIPRFENENIWVRVLKMLKKNWVRWGIVIFVVLCVLVGAFVHQSVQTGASEDSSSTGKAVIKIPDEPVRDPSVDDDSDGQVVPCNLTEDVLEKLNLIWTPPVNDGTIVFDCTVKFQYFKNAAFTLEDLAREGFKLEVATR
eukprot:763589_1